MKRGFKLRLGRGKWLFWLLLAALGVAGLMLYRLGSLVGGLSAGEMTMAKEAVGWQGIWQNPLYLPLKLVQSVVFFLAPDHGQLLTRLPNAVFGFLSIVSFAWLIWLWHGTRTAILAGLLFATSAWTLHVSRLASYDVLYLAAVPMLLAMQVLLHRQGQRAVVWYGNILLMGLLLYIPGMVWLVLLHLYLQRALLWKAWRSFTSGWRRFYTVLLILLPLPLLVRGLTQPGLLVQWLGLPASWDPPLTILKNFTEVFINLFLAGPRNPEIWLGRAPLLDIFSLLVCGLGIYFYASHVGASRSRAIGLTFIVGIILVALDGPVGLSLLVPLLYVAAAAGIAYLLHEWLKVFPLNPVARGIGIGLISVAVAVSCFYNLRSYFVVWPHNPPAQAVFRHHR